MGVYSLNAEAEVLCRDNRKVTSRSLMQGQGFARHLPFSVPLWWKTRSRPHPNFWLNLQPRLCYTMSAKFDSQWVEGRYRQPASHHFHKQRIFSAHFNQRQRI